MIPQKTRLVNCQGGEKIAQNPIFSIDNIRHLKYNIATKFGKHNYIFISKEEFILKTYGRLREKIKEKYNDRKAFASDLGMNPCTLSNKLNGKTAWNSAEILKTLSLLGLSSDDIPEYFFYN